MSSQKLLLVGASTRAAAFSALRAGLCPTCIDLFADVDLQQRCTVTRLASRYPDGFQRHIESDPSVPWTYTGGLENRPRLVQRMAQRRPLWGNAEKPLSLCRDPKYVSAILRSARIPVPAVIDTVAGLSPSRRWLLKPRHSAGGSGIRFWTSQVRGWNKRAVYFQEWIDGQSYSLLFVGDGRRARPLCITRQLVGEPWLHAAPFHYCGSIGPLGSQIVQRPSLEELGHVLASKCFLRGLFGVDGILRQGTFWPVEINPRYTASVEVLEHGTEIPIFGCHAHVFIHGRLPPLPSFAPTKNRMIGKAILFARGDLHFPADGPWMAQLRSPRPIEELPSFADIPAAGELIRAGKPILTFFAAADSASICENALREIATDLDRWLFKS